MGHGVTSALIAILGMGSLRNSRRAGHSLSEQADHASATITRHTPVRGGFITAVLGRLDLETGQCEVINAGHIPPVLVRDGDPQPLDLPRNFRLSMVPDSPFHAGQVTPRPGDRLVIVTDGMRERRAVALDLPAKLRSLTVAHPREAARPLADAVLEVAGPALADDATLLIIDWHGHHGRPHRADGGADLAAGTSADHR